MTGATRGTSWATWNSRRLQRELAEEAREERRVAEEPREYQGDGRPADGSEGAGQSRLWKE